MCLTYWSFEISNNIFVDPKGESLTIEVNYEEGEIPEWLYWDQSVLSGEFPADARGMRKFTLIATDDYGASSPSSEFNVNVLNNPP